MGCRRLPGVQYGACSNCIWQSRAPHCEHADQDRISDLDEVVRTCGGPAKLPSITSCRRSRSPSPSSTPLPERQRPAAVSSPTSRSAKRSKTESYVSHSTEIITIDDDSEGDQQIKHEPELSPPSGQLASIASLSKEAHERHASRRLARQAESRDMVARHAAEEAEELQERVSLEHIEAAAKKRLQGGQVADYSGDLMRGEGSANEGQPIEALGGKRGVREVHDVISSNRSGGRHVSCTLGNAPAQRTDSSQIPRELSSITMPLYVQSLSPLDLSNHPVPVTPVSLDLR